MRGRSLPAAGAWPLFVAALVMAAPGASLAQTSAGGDGGSREGLAVWLPGAREGLLALSALGDRELGESGVLSLVRLYLDCYEPLEAWYGPGSRYAVAPLAAAVGRGEARFHAALQSEPGELRSRIAGLLATLDTLAELAAAAAVPATVPGPRGIPGVPEARGTRIAMGSWTARTQEVAGILAALGLAEARHGAGDAAGALGVVEQVYLDRIEPLEPRLPGALSRRVESLIHLRLRPGLARSEPRVQAEFESLRGVLAEVDAALAGGRTFWFGAANAFVIIVREGLEAVLLIAAILAYLKGTAAARREQRRVVAGAGLGIAATLGTWLMARTLLPVTGAGRELMEGATALAAVAVLLWVSHWLFQKTYLHDWKEYLRTSVGQAVGRGSALAMAGLAFAAVYREGFETVLFYQALLPDSSPGAVLAGFLPGAALILGFGLAVLRLGLRLPLRALFGITNAILLCLAFVFLGKGIYNLQEAGLFTPRPVEWLPDHGVLHQVFGLYPLAETLVAQVAYVTLLVATWVFHVRFRRGRGVRAERSRRGSG